MSATSKVDLAARIDEVFLKVTSTSGTCDLVSVAKVFWPVLDNKISIVDLAGVYTMCISNNGSEVLISSPSQTSSPESPVSSTAPAVTSRRNFWRI